MTKIHIKKYAVSVIVFVSIVFSISSCSTSKYPFRYYDERNVTMAQSGNNGAKIVEVVAYGRNAEKAINRAMVDAVVAATFIGIPNDVNSERIPAILKDGELSYSNNKKFFNRFFKKGEFLPYVQKINSGYPTGLNNVKTSKGRKVCVTLQVNWTELLKFYQAKGLETNFMGLDKF